MRKDEHPAVRVYDSIEDLSSAAADVVVSCSEQKDKPARGVAVALSGGTTPKRLFSILAADPYRARIDWSSLHLFWTDERCVPPGDRNSNFGMLKRTLLDEVMIPEGNIHRIRGEADPEAAAREYEVSLSSYFGKGSYPVFDLVLLGAGADGHTASLFPGSPALRERTRLAVPVFREPPDLNRVSLTLPVLNHAAKVLYLLSGSAKAAVLHEILEDGNPKRCPAGLVKPERGTVTWMIDREAAALLTRRPVAHP